MAHRDLDLIARQAPWVPGPQRLLSIGSASSTESRTRAAALALAWLSSNCTRTVVDTPAILWTSVPVT